MQPAAFTPADDTTRSPLVAGALGVLPGAGHLYAGETKRGLIVIAATLVAMDLSMTDGTPKALNTAGQVALAGSWAFSIVDGALAAKRYNRKHSGGAKVAVASRGQSVTTAHSWPQLASMPLVGTSVTVTMMRGRAEGVVRSLDVRTIAIERDGNRTLIPAAEVLEIRRAGVRKRRVLRRGIPVGMVVGGLALVVIDSRSGNPEPGEAAAMGAVLIGLPVGALTAALWPEVPPLYTATPAPPRGFN